MKLKVIVTGATGMVGEGVLLVCLEHPSIEKVLIVNRKSVARSHPKLSECVIRDFMKAEEFKAQLTGYDACFYCAGISSAGLSEDIYTQITYDTPLHFANVLLQANPAMTFCHISGSHTDSSEKGRIMWARVKGKAENALMRLPFKKVYNFRPGGMKPVPGQKNVKPLYRFVLFIFPLLRLLMPNNVCTLQDLGTAMIQSVRRGYAKNILECPDIKALART